MPCLRQDLWVALALGVSVLAIAGCGGENVKTVTRTSAGPEKVKPHPRGKKAGVAARCGLGGFLHALDTLESRLAAGLSYEQYFAEVRGTKSAYESVQVGELELPCLSGVGTPAEKALNQYIEAANVWRECRADARCGTYSIEPRLQRKWRVASHYIAIAQTAG